MKINQLKAGAVLSYIALFLGTAISLVYTPFMLRSLGQSEYGVFTLVNSTIVYLTVLDFGFGNAIIRYTAKFRAENNKDKERSMHGMFLVLYSIIGAMAFCIGLVLVFNVDALFSNALSLKELNTSRFLMWIAVINVAISFPLGIFYSIIKAYERFVFAQIANILRLILNPSIMVIVLLIGSRSVGMLIASTILNGLFSMIFMVYCIKKLKISFRFRGFDKPLLKEISQYSFYVFLGIIVDRIYWSSGQVLLGMLSGTVGVSVFALGALLSQNYISLSGAVSGVFLPRLTAMNVKNASSSQLSDILIKVGRLQFVVLALALLGFILVGQDFIILWAGPEYLTTFYITLVLIVPLTIPLTQNIGISILQARNKHGFRSVVYIFIALANILISIPLIKVFGALGSALGTGISLVAGQIITMNIYYYKVTGLNIPRFWLEICKLLPAVAMTFLLFKGVRRFVVFDGFMGLFLNVAIITLAYGTFMWFLGLNSYEKDLIIQPLKRIIKRKGVI